MKASTQELRERIVAAVDHGVPREEVAEVFGVGLSTIKRALKQRREAGNIAAKPIEGTASKASWDLSERASASSASQSLMPLWNNGVSSGNRAMVSG